MVVLLRPRFVACVLAGRMRCNHERTGALALWLKEHKSEDGPLGDGCPCPLQALWTVPLISCATYYIWIARRHSTTSLPIIEIRIDLKPLLDMFLEFCKSALATLNRSHIQSWISHHLSTSYLLDTPRIANTSSIPEKMTFMVYSALGKGQMC